MVHPEYGLGRIVAIEGEGPDARGESRSPSAPRGRSCWPNPRCGRWQSRPGQSRRAGSGQRRPRREELPRPARSPSENAAHATPGCQYRSCRHAPPGTRRAANPTRSGRPCSPSSGGADGITIHLREDRRHIQDRDVHLLRETVQVRLNLELALEPAIVALALGVRPDQVTFVPERRAELTTEGGLDVAGQSARVGEALARCRDAGIEVALFIDPDLDAGRGRRRAGRRAVEFHTGRYADAPRGPTATASSSPSGGRRGDHRRRAGIARRPRPELSERRAGRAARTNGRAQHRPQHRQPRLFVGLQQAVREMKTCIASAVVDPTGKPRMIRCARHDQATFHGRHHECRHLCARPRRHTNLGAIFGKFREAILCPLPFRSELL